MLFNKDLFKVVLVLGFSVALMLSCASVKMADIPTTAEPREEIAKLDSEIRQAVSKNIDVLASKDFNKSKTYLLKAKSGVESGKSQSDILDSLRAGKGHLIEAYVVAGNRANAVATYFKSNGLANIKIESEGYGYKKPIATNKSKDGRAQNRRVDIVISPNTTTY